MLHHRGLVPPDVVVRSVELGMCPLDSGETLLDCRLGYMTLGKLNAARDNAVIFTLWGTHSYEAIEYLGPGKLFDPKNDFIIVLEPFGGGGSSAPSRSSKQAGASFPAVSIRDVVRAQRRVIEEHFGLRDVRALVGYSMGGMLALDWGVSHPDFAKKYVVVGGTPRPTAGDIAGWNVGIDFLNRVIACACVPPLDAKSKRVIDAFLPAAVQAELTTAISSGSLKPETVLVNRVFTFRTSMTQNVAIHTAGDMKAAAKRIGEKLLFVIGRDDNGVDPEPARMFARLGGAQVFEIASCGHDVFICAPEKSFRAISAFLQAKPLPNPTR